MGLAEKIAEKRLDSKYKKMEKRIHELELAVTKQTVKIKDLEEALKTEKYRIDTLTNSIMKTLASEDNV